MGPENTVKVRRAGAEDDRRLGDLLVESFVSSYARKMPEVVVSDARKADLRDIASKRASGCVLVAEDPATGELLATVTLLPPGHPTSRAWLPGLSDLRYMAVDSRAKGHGLTGPLLAEARKVAREWGARGICLHVRRGAHGVAAVYTKNGYRRVPEGDQDQLPEIFLEAFLLEL